MAESFVFLVTCFMCVALIGATSKKVQIHDICKIVPVNTKILVPGSCADWVECGNNGEVIDEGTCLQGWLFDRNTSKCNKGSKVDCPYTKLMTPCAKAKNGTFLQRPKSNCRGYIFCNEGRAQYSDCPLGLIFNPETESCVYPTEYECPEEDQDDKLNEICLSVGDNIRMADPTSCSAFKVCVKGVLKTTHCITGTFFSLETKKCGDYEESQCLLEEESTTEKATSMICGTNENPIVGFISDGKTCSGYYYCDEMENGKPDRNPTFAKCTDGKFFDANLFSCKDRTNVRCPYDRCEGMGSQFVNRQGDCTKYSNCSGGKTVGAEGSCPENFYFDEKLQSCTKTVINYMACAE